MPHEDQCPAKDALSRIEFSLAEHIDREAIFQDRVHARLDRIDVTLRGNGSSTGFHTRLDRLERSEVGRTRLIWVAVTAGTSAIIAWSSTHWAR